MHLRVRPLDIDDERDIEGSFRVVAAAQPHDVPDFPPWSWTDHVGRLRHPWPGMSANPWLAVDGADVLGVLDVDLPTLDNTHLAEVELIVHPEHRRKGVGTALYAKAIDVARIIGRTALQGHYVTSLPGGASRGLANARFAEAMGAKAALPEVRRRLDLPGAAPRDWAPLRDEARAMAAGYSTVVWTDATPEDLVDDVARLNARLVIDAPMGDLLVEPERIDADRVRAIEETIRLRGRRNYNVGARHDASGRLAAWTQLAFDADTRSHAWQHITIVDPDHRGHRLGLLVKIENLLFTLTHEPDLRHVNTWNATENAHMIAINEALGFRAVDGWVSWQHEI